MKSLKFGLFTLLLVLGSTTFSLAQQRPLQFVSPSIPTLVAPSNQPARLQEIVKEALDKADIAARFNIERRAFVGSGLISGKFDGHFSIPAFDEPSSRFIYSEPVLPLALYLVSKNIGASEIKLIDELDDKRVGILNRHAFNPLIRSYAEVKWSRNPTLTDLFKQLGDERADYALLDKLTLDELNLLLLAEGQELLDVSPTPLITTHYLVSFSKDIPNVEQHVESFNQAIAKMTSTGRVDALLSPVDYAKPRASLLNASSFERILRRW